MKLLLPLLLITVSGYAQTRQSYRYRADYVKEITKGKITYKRCAYAVHINYKDSLVYIWPDWPYRIEVITTDDHDNRWLLCRNNGKFIMIRHEICPDNSAMLELNWDFKYKNKLHLTTYQLTRLTDDR